MRQGLITLYDIESKWVRLDVLVSVFEGAERADGGRCDGSSRRISGNKFLLDSPDAIDNIIS